MKFLKNIYWFVLICWHCLRILIEIILIGIANKEFFEYKFAGDETNEIKNTINETEIKNELSTTHENIPKFSLKIYA